MTAAFLASTAATVYLGLRAGTEGFLADPPPLRRVSRPAYIQARLPRRLLRGLVIAVLALTIACGSTLIARLLGRGLRFVRGSTTTATATAATTGITARSSTAYISAATTIWDVVGAVLVDVLGLVRFVVPFPSHLPAPATLVSFALVLVWVVLGWSITDTVVKMVQDESLTLTHDPALAMETTLLLVRAGKGATSTTTTTTATTEQRTTAHATTSLMSWLLSTNNVSAAELASLAVEDIARRAEGSDLSAAAWRSQLFADGHGSTWRRLAGTCVDHLTEFTDAVRAAIPIAEAAGAEEKTKKSTSRVTPTTPTLRSSPAKNIPLNPWRGVTGTATGWSSPSLWDPTRKRKGDLVRMGPTRWHVAGMGDGMTAADGDATASATALVPPVRWNQYGTGIAQRWSWRGDDRATRVEEVRSGAVVASATLHGTLRALTALLKVARSEDVYGLTKLVRPTIGCILAEMLSCILAVQTLRWHSACLGWDAGVPSWWTEMLDSGTWGRSGTSSSHAWYSLSFSSLSSSRRLWDSDAALGGVEDEAVRAVYDVIAAYRESGHGGGDRSGEGMMEELRVGCAKEGIRFGSRGEVERMLRAALAGRL